MTKIVCIGTSHALRKIYNNFMYAAYPIFLSSADNSFLPITGEHRVLIVDVHAINTNFSAINLLSIETRTAA